MSVATENHYLIRWIGLMWSPESYSISSAATA